MSVLALASPRWRELREMAGRATAIPALIREIADDPHAVDWHDVFTRLCHQGTTYSATYAVVPHLVQIAGEHPLARCHHLLVFIGEVAEADETSLRRDLVRSYRAAVRRAEPLIVRALHGKPVDLHRAYLRLALAKVRGDCDRARALADAIDRR